MFSRCLKVAILPLLFGLYGCNSSSSSNNTGTAALPKADYVFSTADKQKLLVERNEILESVVLSVDDREYNKLNYADEASGGKLLQLESNDGEKVTLFIADSDNPNAICVIYKSGSDIDAFKCDNSLKTESGDMTLFPMAESGAKKKVQLEYATESIEYWESIGSTVLTPLVTAAGMEIRTSFAFEDYTRQIVCGGVCAEKRFSTLGATTYFNLQGIVNSGLPDSVTLVFNNNIGGSGDDEINMYTGLLIRDSKMKTKVSSIGSVFSGGTDLFSAGVERTLEIRDSSNQLEKNQQIGVHSWGEGSKTAKDFPYTNVSHRKQATYFTKMLGDKGVSFYIYTLDSAPASGAHYMTRKEMDTYQFVTEFL
ncbi:hypothetical protein FCV43_07955 [Vibrio genomosp. F6]|uniref:hypothetical protein n=1 Tax=Vibrio genomosp. F6 TaxID=723172 RepID=UPI0010BDAE4B|nr:hypothetical protein [Vibrio genomosp. F6]TKF22007.1 hypothetical protein FCV43_07955 [Vibrio genomosp. F6]